MQGKATETSQDELTESTTTSTDSNTGNNQTETDTTEKSLKSETGEDGTAYSASFGSLNTRYHNKTNQQQSRTGSTKKGQLSYQDTTQAGTHSEITHPAELTGRQVFFMRHAERIDHVFRGWERLAFTDHGRYRPYDLNQPLTLPKREGSPQSYVLDTPITEAGFVSAQMVGRAMRVTKVYFNAIYTSPALRCLQTGQGILKTLNTNVKMCVEPGLFEWMEWYEKTPKWLTKTEMLNAKLKVDADYRPIMTTEELVTEKKTETAKEHYKRMANVVEKILKRQKTTGPILIIGHGTTVEAGIRYLLREPRKNTSRESLAEVGDLVPCCGLEGVEERNDGVWNRVYNTLPPITLQHSDNRLRLSLQNVAQSIST